MTAPAVTPRETAQRMAEVWFTKISAMGYLDILEDRDLNRTFEALLEQVWAIHGTDKRMSSDDWIESSDRLQGGFPTWICRTA